MNTKTNAVHMRIEEHQNAYTEFRNLYRRLDELIEAIYSPWLYTLGEFEQLASEYRNLQIRADRMEETIRHYYPSKHVDEDIKRMKSNFGTRDDPHPGRTNLQSR